VDVVKCKFPVVFRREEIVVHDILRQQRTAHPQVPDEETLIVLKQKMHTTLLPVPARARTAQLPPALPGSRKDVNTTL
jgi:hypothetical protein